MVHGGERGGSGGGQCGCEGAAASPDAAPALGSCQGHPPPALWQGAWGLGLGTEGGAEEEWVELSVGLGVHLHLHLRLHMKGVGDSARLCSLCAIL